MGILHVSSLCIACRNIMDCRNTPPTSLIPLWTAAILFVTTIHGRAELKLHALFTDHAVLQQGVSVPVWGSADAGAIVKVSFSGQRKETKTPADGTWMILLDALAANPTPQFMTVSSGNDKLTVSDLLIGEVWLCSGQSNMARAMGGMKDKADVIADVNAGKFETLRLFKAPLSGKNTPQTEVDAIWQKCTETSVNRFSGTGFYFGRALHRDLKVPIGLLSSSYGGTNAFCWISKNTLENNPVATDKKNSLQRSIANYPLAKKQYDDALNEWTSKGKKGNPPREPMGKDHMKQPAGFYNGMIAPLQPFAIAGVIWYQGESNATNLRSASQYGELMLALVEGWRADWAKKGPSHNFPFYQVQLPNYAGGHPQAWPVIREQMLRVWKKGSNTGMVTTIDIGNPMDIHPQNKRIVGERLSRFARGDAYDQDLVISGPIYQSMEIKDQTILINFDHVGKGISSKDGKALRHFAIAGADKNFVPATAEINKDGTITVSSPEVKEPKAARYAWSNNPEEINFFNDENLPASPFRTDKWEIVSP